MAELARGQESLQYKVAFHTKEEAKAKIWKTFWMLERVESMSFSHRYKQICCWFAERETDDNKTARQLDYRCTEYKSRTVPVELDNVLRIIAGDPAS